MTNNSTVHLQPAPPSVLTAQEAVARLVTVERALDYARSIIESYQSDIRNSEWTGMDLVAVGFCQGTIYRNALSRIDTLLQEAAT